MLKTNVYDDFLIPITLEPNHEYSIRVTPYGMESSEEFKDLTKEQRNCKLENEVDSENFNESIDEVNNQYHEELLKNQDIENIVENNGEYYGE